MDNDTSSHDRSDEPKDEELIRRADNGDPLSDEELERLASYGRCPFCGQLPSAEPGYLDCQGTGFHRPQDAGAPPSSEDPAEGPPGASQGVGRDYATIPDGMKQRRQWVCWKTEPRPGSDKLRKVPYNPETGAKASVTDSLTWGTFDEAVAAHEAGTYDGVGLVFSTGDPFTFIDLDHAVDPELVVQTKTAGLSGFHSFKPWAESLIHQLAPYAYIGMSWSGTGAHIILNGKLPGPGGKRPVETNGVPDGEIEMYDRERFVALTGETLHSGNLTSLQSAINQVWRHFGFGGSGDTDHGAGWGSGAYDGPVWSSGLSVDEAIAKARNAKNGDAFAALFDRGDLSSHGGDHSRADMALVGTLAFYLGPDPKAIDTAFRRSKLFRPKWDEQHGSCSYGERTIARILRDRGPDASAYFGSRTKSSSGESGFSSASSAYFADQTDSNDTVPAPRFPIEILPLISRAFVEQGEVAIGVPPEMVAVPFLVNVGAAIGNTRRIQLKQGYEQFPILFAAVIAKPGSAKTPSADYARRPLDALQEEAHLKFRNLHRQWELAVREAKKKKGIPIPDPPMQEQFYTTNVTTEAIAMLVEQNPGLGVLSDELVGWFKSLDAYRKGGDKQFYLSLWAGTAIKVDRKTALPVYVPRPAVSVFGTIQPDLLASLADEANRQDGFLDRWLMVMPDAGFTKWTEETIKRKPVDDMTKVFRRLRYPKGYETPVILPLSTEARTVFREWYAENGHIAEDSSGLAAGCAAKYPNQCARLTLILHLLAYPDDLVGPIEADTVRDAITLIEYFRASLVRILPKFNATASHQTAGLLPRIRRILEAAQGEWVDRTSINTALSGHVRADDITTTLKTLGGQGLAESRTVATSGRPKEQWRLIVPVTHDGAEKAEDADNAEKRRTGAEDIASEPSHPFGRPGRRPPPSGPFAEGP